MELVRSWRPSLLSTFSAASRRTASRSAVIWRLTMSNTWSRFKSPFWSNQSPRRAFAARAGAITGRSLATSRSSLFFTSGVSSRSAHGEAASDAPPPHQTKRLMTKANATIVIPMGYLRLFIRFVGRPTGTSMTTLGLLGRVSSRLAAEYSAARGRLGDSG